MTARPVKHGLSYTPEYRAWQQMRLRCLNPEHAAFAAYGGRGITVCARWADSPAAFMADMGPKPTPAHEIDRIDNDRGYEPSNCRWATRSENDRNRRSTRWITHDGETLPLVAWSERTGIRADTIVHRLRSGQSAAEALTAPVRPKSAKGQGRPTKHACLDCPRLCLMAADRCKACSNKHRGRAREQHAAEEAA